MKVAMFLIVVVMAVATAVESKSSSSAPPAVDCSSVILSLSDCLSFVTNGSTINKPEGSCCSGLKTVLKKNAECLCEGFKSSSQFGVVLNMTKALALPSACGVHAPSLSTCGLSLSPTGAPSPAGAVVSPAGAPAGSTIDNAPALGPGGNIVSPALAPSITGAASDTAVSVQLIVVGLAAAFFSSF